MQEQLKPCPFCGNIENDFAAVHPQSQMAKKLAGKSGVLFLPQLFWLRLRSEISAQIYECSESWRGVGWANPRTDQLAAMKNFNSNTANNDEWLTPPELLRALGPFDLDPCAPAARPWPMARQHYTKLDNGLALPWHGRVWLNPPYGRETFKWLERLAEHKDGIALIFARTETRGFHDTIWGKATSVFFFRGRLCFHHVSGEKGGTANAPSCLVAYSQADTEAIKTAISRGMDGKLVILS